MIIIIIVKIIIMKSTKVQTLAEFGGNIVFLD